MQTYNLLEDMYTMCVHPNIHAHLQDIKKRLGSLQTKLNPPESCQDETTGEAWREILQYLVQRISHIHKNP